MTERFHVITGLSVLLTVVFTFGYPDKKNRKNHLYCLITFSSMRRLWFFLLLCHRCRT